MGGLFLKDFLKKDHYVIQRNIKVKVKKKSSSTEEPRFHIVDFCSASVWQFCERKNQGQGDVLSSGSIAL